MAVKLVEMNFLFIGNSLAADFVNTEVASPRGKIDLLSSPESLSSWFDSAGCARGIKCNEKELEEAKELRTTVRRIFDRVLEAKTLHASDIDLLNERSNDLNRILAGSHNNYKLSFKLESASDVLALIAQTCSELLASPRLNSMRRCASEKCIFYFVDSSKNQQRHWCSMETCGNREKVRKHYDKNKVR